MMHKLADNSDGPRKAASLRAELSRVRRRVLMIGTSAAAVWTLLAAMVLVAAGVWCDLLWELTGPLRVAAWAVTGTGGAVVLAGLIRSTWRAARDAAVARRLDAVAHTGGEILTGLDLDRPEAGEENRRAVELSNGLARLAVERAATLASDVQAKEAVPPRPIRRSAAWLAMAAVLLGLIAVCLPRLARTEWLRFTQPFADIPPFSWIEFQVEPGNTTILYGGRLEIAATTSGSPTDRVDLVIEGPDGRRETLPMFSEPKGRWRSGLAQVTEPAVYFVRSYRARSMRYRINVITVPQIEGVRFTVTPPAYTRRAAYDGPLPKDGLSGLPGARVEVRATSNRPLSGGRVLLEDDGGPVEIAMTPAAAGSREVQGEFVIRRGGKFRIQVTDVAGQTSPEGFAGSVTLLADERPFLRIIQPRPMSLATAGAALPVALSAEDDYGVAKLFLYRSLNDSRPMPMDVSLPPGPPARAYESIRLPLDRYGLSPGDTIKLFGRVEDNDPAGPKGAESGVVAVRIISQEEFERLARMRKGLEMLMSKYREARRRAESLAEQIETLKKKLADEPKDGRVADQTRNELRRLMKMADEDVKALRRLAQQPLPYDIDKNLASQFRRLADSTDALARALEALEKQGNLANDETARQLAELARRLQGQREQFDREAMRPMEELEAVMRLVADESRFAALALRQKDLAERLASLRGEEGNDDPSRKVRMREMEEEEQALRDELRSLLEEILNHAEALPEEPRFDKLRRSAQKFVRDVESSGASEAMADASAALGEFSGTRAHQKAKEAADILARFLRMCEGGMAGAGKECLVFQPSLSQGLGSTIEQLLADMGLGSGEGAGTGGYGGYSARRGPGNDWGLYGSMPGMDLEAGQGSGASALAGDGAGSYGQGLDNPDQATWLDAAADRTAGGAGEAAIPVRYREQVGKYFRRLAEELGK